MAFQLGPSQRVHRGTRVPLQWVLLVGVVFGGALVGMLASRGLFGPVLRQQGVDLDIDPRPIITSLQTMGQLHTVKMTMKEVLRKSSEKDPEGWLKAVPGGDNLTHWATHNQVLVVAEGSIEAGIDLSKISSADVSKSKLPDGHALLRIHLPRPEIYPPNITIRVENIENGLLWRDDNLVPKAQEEASARFKDAAEKDHIVEKAEESAIQRLRQMQEAMGRKDVEFYF